VSDSETVGGFPGIIRRSYLQQRRPNSERVFHLQPCNFMLCTESGCFIANTVISTTIGFPLFRFARHRGQGEKPSIVRIVTEKDRATWMRLLGQGPSKRASSASNCRKHDVTQNEVASECACQATISIVGLCQKTYWQDEGDASTLLYWSSHAQR
jgi:hypothetical protein